VLESLGLPLSVVDAIAGQSRFEITFHGHANHAATPMPFRRDALAGAAEWIGAVEREACGTEGLSATVGRLEADPGAGNVIAGTARASLDVRHRDDAVRHRAVEHVLQCASEIALRRGLAVQWESLLDRPAVRMDERMKSLLERAAGDVPTLTSGAGHDAMIMASRMPACMLFLRSPGGISHHPDEAVLAEDVEAGLQAGLRFLEALHG